MGSALCSAGSARIGGPAAAGPEAEVLPGGCPALGQDGLRDTRSTGPELVAVGWYGAGAPVGSRGSGGGHLGTKCAAHPEQLPAQAVASSSVVVAQDSARCCCRRRGAESQRSLQPPLAAHAVVLCVDEKTNLQPRTRKARTLPPQPGRPMLVENEYERKGAVHWFAAFDTRSGKVYPCTGEHTRQIEFIQLLEILDREFDAAVTAIHIVLDNLRMHKGKLVKAWLGKHTRFQFPHPPVHCSWMNQVEQWFSILQRQRLGITNFADKKALPQRIDAFVREWNSHAHAFRWSSKSFDKVLAECQKNMATAV